MPVAQISFLFQTRSLEGNVLSAKKLFGKKSCPVLVMFSFMNCPIYEGIRSDLYVKSRNINSEFSGLNDDEKMCFLLSNDDIVQYTAKACYEILKLRQIFIYR